MEFFIPDELWEIIKSYIGMQKYYLYPAKLKKNLNMKFYANLSNITFADVLHTLQNTRPFVLCLYRIFLYMIKNNDKIQLLRNRGFDQLWDHFSFILATRTQRYLEEGRCDCQNCTDCFLSDAVHALSGHFYLLYIQ